MRLFAVHDKKAQALASFQAMKNDAVASRHFADAVLEEKSPLGKYPDDFELVVLADLGEDTKLPGEQLVVPLELAYTVVVTARQIVDVARPEKQLELLKEG